MQTKVVRPVLVRQQVYLALQEAIYQGEIAAGTYLNERELGERFGVSRTPIREALQRLELEGLVMTVPRKGILVQNANSQYTDELFYILAALESLVAKLAAMKATPADCLILKQLVQQIKSDPIRHHDTLLTELLRISSTKRLPRLLGPMLVVRQHMVRHSIMMPDRQVEIAKEHKAVIDCICCGDATGAAKAMHSHIEKALQAYKKTQP